MSSCWGNNENCKTRLARCTSPNENLVDPKQSEKNVNVAFVVANNKRATCGKSFTMNVECEDKDAIAYQEVSVDLHRPDYGPSVHPTQLETLVYLWQKNTRLH